MHSSVGTVVKKIFKAIGWVIATVITLLIMLALLIQIPAIQLKLTQKAVSILEDKLGTDVSLSGISIRFPTRIVLEGIYFEDQQGDTLLYAGRLALNTDMWALTKNKILLNDVALENAVAFISRPENDSAFNYAYMLDAFAGDSTAAPDTLEQNGWDFSIRAVALENIRLSYRDLLGGNIANLSLGNFEIDMNDFDLEANRFAVGEISMSDAQARFTQTKLAPTGNTDEQAADSTAALLFSLENLNVDRVNIDYAQPRAGLAMHVRIGTLALTPEQIDLQHQRIAIESFSLANSRLSYMQRATDSSLKQSKSSEPADTAASPGGQWKISLKRLALADNTIDYDDYDASPEVAEGVVDFSHLGLTNLDVAAHDLLYAPEHIDATLDRLAFKERSGFMIADMSGNLTLNETSASIGDFLLTTGASRLEMQAQATFPSFADIANTWPQATIASRITNAHVSVRDLRYFQPALLDSLPVSLPADADLHIDASVNGTANNLHIRHLLFSALSDTELSTSGRISGLANPDHLRLDVAVEKFVTSRRDIQRLLPDALTDSLNLPEWIKLTARYAGTTDAGTFSAQLASDVGSIALQGQMNLDSTSTQRGIDATVDVDNLKVGDLLGKPDSVMGALTMRLEARSKGLSPEEMDATITGNLARFDFKGYTYADLALSGNIRNQIASLTAKLADRNLAFNLDAAYNFSGAVPRYGITLDVKNADFEALNLSTRPLRGRGILKVDLATSDFKVLNGNVGLQKVAIFNGDERYAIDSLLFASIDQEGRSEIDIDSDLLSAKFEGTINIFALPGVAKAYFNSYYHLHDSLDVQDSGNQHFSFSINLKNTDILTGLLIPDLTAFVPGEIKGEFDSERKQLDLRLEVDEVQYKNIGVRSLVFSTNSNSNELNYNLMVDRVMVDSVKVDGLEFNGTVANDAIKTDLIILDSADTHKYVFAGTVSPRGDNMELRLAPDGIILNYQPWSVPDNNYMRFGGDKFVAQNVQLTNRREKIIIASRPEAGTPIHIGFRELNLEYLTSMVAVERPLSGLLEGDLRIYPDTASFNFTSNITIDGLHVRDIPWGDLALQVEKTTRSRFDVDFGLHGNGNDVRVEGFYTGGSSTAMDLKATIARFNLAALQPIVAGQFRDIKGTFVGDIRARGTPAAPEIDGRVLFKNTEFLSTYLNAPFSIDNESISFIDEGISFNAFEIADANNNKARINGTMLTRNYRDFKFNLDLVTDHFRLLNTREGDNPLFYGLIELEANARIRGDMNTPVISMTIGLSDQSHLTYVVPQSNSAVLKTEGIVKFVDKTFENDPFMKKTEVEAADTIKSTFRGIDLTARIELTDQEQLTIVIDPLTGDQLSIRGNSTLTLGVDPTGDIHLTGRYEISQGTYNLSFYKFVKREFQIEKGSTITWTGDPLNAAMDIRAIYTVETSPIELFSNQLTGTDPAEANRYKQRLPFMVYLNISGQLLQPEISFQLEMPMDERNALGGNVYARIQDINTRESDLNKQVFALLILKRFIADNPFENNAGGGFESTARRSVSKILSEQLNRLSQNIKGVELSFDIKSYEDYSSGAAEGRTQLELGFSKSLLHDRLVVKLSGNIDLEGETNHDATDYIGDLALEYKMTPDGRFRITGFRNSDYDMIDGELIETGVGFIYVKDYNSLSELFKANAETKN